MSADTANTKNPLSGGWDRGLLRNAVASIANIRGVTYEEQARASLRWFEEHPEPHTPGRGGAQYPASGRDAELTTLRLRDLYRCGGSPLTKAADEEVPRWVNE